MKSKELFQSPLSAAESWARHYSSLNTDYEFGALLYERRDKHDVSYLVGKTRKGSKGNGSRIRPNVVIPIILALLLDWMCFFGKPIGLLHTHPISKNGKPSTAFSNEDKQLTTGRYGIKLLYVFMIPQGGGRMLTFKQGDQL